MAGSWGDLGGDCCRKRASPIVPACLLHLTSHQVTFAFGSEDQESSGGGEGGRGVARKRLKIVCARRWRGHFGAASHPGGRLQLLIQDPLALRHHRSALVTQYFEQTQAERAARVRVTENQRSRPVAYVMIINMFDPDEGKASQILGHVIPLCSHHWSVRLGEDRLGHISRRRNLNGQAAGVISAGFTVKSRLGANKGFSKNRTETRLFFFFHFQSRPLCGCEQSAAGWGSSPHPPFSMYSVTM